MKLVVYNIFKANLPGLGSELTRLSKEADFACIQEWVSSLKKLSNHFYQENFTFSLPLSRVKTGTCLAVQKKYEVVSTENRVTASREFGFITPKSAIIMTVKVQDRELCLVNIHALNFVSNTVWKKEIGLLMKEVPNDIPTIIAGDFNTWNSTRFNFLEECLRKVGFRYAHYDYNLIFRLDHIFYRGITVNSCKCLVGVHTSDHYPLLLDFTLD